MNLTTWLTLREVTGGYSTGPYWQIKNALKAPPPPVTVASVQLAKTAPRNWNVRPGERAMGEDWGEDNNGMG